jgi:hypothetical protein
MAGAIANRRRHGHEQTYSQTYKEASEMVLHPFIQLEIANQRHRELLAEAERRRIASTANAAAPAERRQWRGARTMRPALNPEIARPDVGLEV